MNLFYEKILTRKDSWALEEIFSSFLVAYLDPSS